MIRKYERESENVDSSVKVPLMRKTGPEKKVSAWGHRNVGENTADFPYNEMQISCKQKNPP